MITKCPSCGTQVSDRLAACPKCGAEIPDVKPIASGNRTRTDIWSIIGFICGIMIIILGIIILNKGTEGNRVFSVTFGGDFYTEIHHATRIAANNLQLLCQLMSSGIGYLLLAIGLTDICMFGRKLVGRRGNA